MSLIFDFQLEGSVAEAAPCGALGEAEEAGETSSASGSK